MSDVIVNAHRGRPLLAAMSSVSATTCRPTPCPPCRNAPRTAEAVRTFAYAVSYSLLVVARSLVATVSELAMRMRLRYPLTCRGHDKPTYQGKILPVLTVMHATMHAAAYAS